MRDGRVDEALGVLDVCKHQLKAITFDVWDLKYPESLINFTISHFVTLMMSGDPDVSAQLTVNEKTVHRVVLPFKDQKSADAVKKTTIRPEQENRSHSSTSV